MINKIKDAKNWMVNRYLFLKATGLLYKTMILDGLITMPIIALVVGIFINVLAGIIILSIGLTYAAVGWWKQRKQDENEDNWKYYSLE